MIKRPGKRICFSGETIGYIKVGAEHDYETEDGREIREYECFCTACNTYAIMSHRALMLARSHVRREGKTPSCGCLKYSGFKKHNKETQVSLIGKRFGCLVVEAEGPVVDVGSLKKKRKSWKCKCDCGQTTFVTTGDLTSGNTKSCGCLISVGQMEIAKILTAKQIDFQEEYSFDDLVTTKGNPLRFDFAIFDNKQISFLLEYQGEQHYVERDIYFGKQQRLYTDPQKKQYCKQKNIPLFEIAYNENIATKLDTILNFVHDNTVPSEQITA